MPKSDEFYTFDEVVKELKISEDELKKMVSEGEIRAFKDEDKMKFKKMDVEAKKAEHITEPTVILPPGEMEVPAGAEEAAFIEEDTTSSIGATEEMPIGSDTDVQIPSLLEESEVTTPVEPAPEAGATVEEEISVAETISEEGGVEAIPEEMLETVAEGPKKPKRLGKKKIARFAAQPGQREMVPMGAMPAEAYVPSFRTPAIFIVLLGAAVILLVLVGSILGDALRISANRGQYPTGLTAEVAQTFVNLFGLKDINLKDMQPKGK